MSNQKELIRNSLLEAKNTLDNFISNEKNIETIQTGANLLVETLKSGNKIIGCGNGGSMCDAIHFIEELTGRYRDDRPALAAIAISDPGHLTCVGNDIGYDRVFSRYVEGLGKKGDTLVAISTSGKSPSIVEAAKTARSLGMNVIGLTGKEGTALEESSNITLIAKAGKYADRVQEIHIKVLHIWIEMVERELFPENYQ